MLLTTILTAPRPNNTEYLTQTLAAFESQQITPMIFRDQQHGNRRMMQLILRWFLTHDEYSRLLFLEDDIIPCQNLAAYAQAVKIPEYWAVLSLFDPRIADRRPQRLSMNAEAFFYTQAIIFPRATVKKLVNFDWNREAPLRNGNGCSGALRRSFTELGFKEYGLQTPNLVQHVGEVSAILKRSTLAFASPSFPGEGLDATTLL